MGYPTDYLGHLAVNPRLNPAEVSYLDAFARSRRWRRPGGPYDVPAEPTWAGGLASAPVPRAYHLPAVGQPGLWCDWTPCPDGCCLSWAGTERFGGLVPWLRYLVGHFLAPGAVAASTHSPRFAEFTFNHRLDGVVVGCRRDNKQLFAVRVHDSHVREEVLWPADRSLRAHQPLPYESRRDRSHPELLRGHRQREGSTITFTGPVTRQARSSATALPPSTTRH